MFGDKTMQTGNSSGTSDLTLSTDVAGWKTWRSQKADGTRVGYYAEVEDGDIWEIGHAPLTYGSPDKLTGRTLASSSTGSLVDFGGVKVYVMSVPLAFVMDHLVNGGGATSRPAWLPTGGTWRDDNAGLGTRAVDYLKTGSGTTANSEKGRLDGATGIYIASNAAPIRDTGTSGATVATDDRGVIVSLNTAAAARVATLPAAATAGVTTYQPGGAGFYVGIYADGIFPALIDTNGSEAVDNAVVPPGQVVWFRSTGTKWLSQGNSNQTLIGRRQTVTRGPLSSGAPNLLATVSGLALSTSNVAAASPLVVRASNSDAERWGWATGNVSFGTLADATTSYLYVTVGVDGILTGGKTTLAPVYQESGAPATTSGQYTFNYGEMKGYLGNGSTADEVFMVFVGEAVTSGGNVTAVTAYVYNGRYVSGFTNTLPTTSTAVSANHNIGVVPMRAVMEIECITTDGSYAVGERISSDAGLATKDSGAAWGAPSIGKTTKVATLSTANSIAFVATTKGGGGFATLTLANWKYRFIADRGWG